MVPSQDSNPRPVNHNSDALPITQLRHLNLDLDISFVAHKYSFRISRFSDGPILNIA